MTKVIKKLYSSHPILLSVSLIVIYIVGSSVSQALSALTPFPYSCEAAFHLVFSAVLLALILKSGLMEPLGLKRPSLSHARSLCYIPLIAIVACNFIFGAEVSASLPETVFFIISMLCVGFLEELIFRGILFTAMSRDGLTAAVIVSSLTFGIGHILNLLRGAELLPTLCQIVYAAAAGFLFVIIFIKSGSIIPQIIAHSLCNSLSIFGKSEYTAAETVISSLVLTAVTVLYALYLIKDKGCKKKNV